MYNFGSPRVGNKRFADSYNQVIKSAIVPSTILVFDNHM